MPKITPQDLIAYTSFEDVKARLPEHLANDIIEAEAEIVEIVGHDFSDTAQYPTLPEKAKVAYLKLAQYFALINKDAAITKGYTGEKIGDYSYTLGGGQTINKPDVEHLLREYRANEAVHKKRTAMRITRL